MIKIARFTFNPLGENTYLLIAEGGECVIVDAGCYNEAEQKRLADYIAGHNLKPVMSLLTHAHPDHVAGVEWAKSRYNIPLALHSADLPLLGQMASYGAMFGFNIGAITPDVDLAEQKTISFGQTTAEVIHTPGHTPGGCCFYSAEAGVVFSGDSLFAEEIGRCDFPGGSLRSLVGSLKEKILPLPKETKVYPGHGPATTVGWERVHNPYLS
jgi:glyoxylase-like metal-dependent hydrolase (beta-lactamase superfamily II)